MENPNENYLFQAGNGSGKTGAFGIPAILAVDPTINDYQVLIIANTRELIRQIKQVLDVISNQMGIVIEIGEGSIVKKCHILVTTPGYFANKIKTRGGLDLKKVKMITFDEADEIFKQENNREIIHTLIDTEFKKKGLKPQFLMFSATFDQDIIEHF